MLALQSYAAPGNCRYRTRATRVEQMARIKSSLSHTAKQKRRVASVISPHRERESERESELFLRRRQRASFHGVSCLQRDQSYVVGGVYILRGSMEPRASTRLRFGVLSCPPGSLSCTLLSRRGTRAKRAYTRTHTCTSFGPASPLPNAPSSFYRSDASTRGRSPTRAATRSLAPLRSSIAVDVNFVRAFAPRRWDHYEKSEKNISANWSI